MMRKHTLDNRKVTCPNAHYLGVHNKLCAKRGDMLIYEQDNHQRTAQDGYSLYLRWINPHWVRAIFDPPQKVPAFFFSAEWPDNKTLNYANEQGSLHEFFISKIGA